MSLSFFIWFPGGDVLKGQHLTLQTPRRWGPLWSLPKHFDQVDTFQPSIARRQPANKVVSKLELLAPKLTLQNPS